MELLGQKAVPFLVFWGNFILFSTVTSTSKWVHKKTMVYSHNRIVHSRNKEGAPTLCSSMDGTGEHYAKWNKPGVRDIYNMISPISGI